MKQGLVKSSVVRTKRPTSFSYQTVPRLVPLFSDVGNVKKELCNLCPLLRTSSSGLRLPPRVPREKGEKFPFHSFSLPLFLSSIPSSSTEGGSPLWNRPLGCGSCLVSSSSSLPLRLSLLSSRFKSPSLNYWMREESVTAKKKNPFLFSKSEICAAS